MRITDDDCPRDDRDPYNVEDIPDEVIERITRIVLEEVVRNLPVPAKRVER